MIQEAATVVLCGAKKVNLPGISWPIIAMLAIFGHDAQNEGHCFAGG